MFFSATVIDNIDPTLTGKIRIKLDYFADIDSKKKVKLTPEDKIFGNSNQSFDAIRSEIELNEGIVAFPTFKNWGGNDKEGEEGNFLVPPIGAKIFVFFANNDMGNCFYTDLTPFSLNKQLKFDSIIEDNIATVSPKEKINLKVIYKGKKGDIFAINETDGNGYILIKNSSGHRIKLYNENSDKFNGIILETKNGNKISLDDGANGVKIETSSGKSFTMNDGPSANGTQIGDENGNRLIFDTINMKYGLFNKEMKTGLIVDYKTLKTTISSPEQIAILGSSYNLETMVSAVNAGTSYLVNSPLVSYKTVNFDVKTLLYSVKAGTSYSINSPLIKLGVTPVFSPILGEMLIQLFNSHVHPERGTPPAVPLTPSILSKTIKISG